MKTETVEAYGWKNCIKVTGGKTEAIVTTEFGPRIISLTHNGSKNHLAVFEETKGKIGKAFTLYGGHRIWHAPEDKIRTYLPDNRPCHYLTDELGVTVACDADASGIEKGLELSVSDEGEVTVTHILRNKNLFDVELSIWGLTQFALGGLLAVPNSKLNTNLVANRAVSLWPYAKMTDSRIYWGDKFVTALPTATQSEPFKFGMTCDEGFAAYFNHNQLVVKRFDYFFGAEYPNYSCNFESYFNHKFIELETLSPLFTLEAGDEERHVEKWHIVDNVAKPECKDEAAIEKAICGLLQAKA